MILQQRRLMMAGPTFLLVLGLMAVFWAPALGQSADGAPAANGAARIDFWDPAQVVERGGYLIWPILLCSVVVLTAGMERLVSLRRGRVIPRSFVREFFRALRLGELTRRKAMELCKANGSPIAALLMAACRHWGRPPAEIEQAVLDSGQREVARLRRNLRTLQGSGNIATLLGLLGTVLGMIQAFNQVAVSEGLGRAEVLAGGIAQALLTTACGLAVAIPALFLYNYFAGKVERLVYEMDHVANSIVDYISAVPSATAPATTRTGKATVGKTTRVGLKPRPATGTHGAS